MSAPVLSVAIATVGRAAKLERTLHALCSPAPGTPPFEVVVVVDGEDPATEAVLREERPFPLRAGSQPSSGPGPARNRAAREATAELVVFLNDDTRPDPGCIAAHLRAQQRHGPCMSEGLVAWDPELEITPYMQWLAPAGHQFNYARLAPGRPIPWDAVWATNLALPRRWVLDEPFEPAFPRGCLEDTEWSFRQHRRGRHAVFVPESVVYHDHRYGGPADYRGRAREFGAAARYVVRRHPGLAFRFIVRPLAAAAARGASLALPSSRRRDRLWDLDFRLNYLAGLLGPRLPSRW